MPVFCLIGTMIYMFDKCTESNLIQVKWNIMLRRHLIFFSGGQFCRFCEKAPNRHICIYQNIRGEKNNVTRLPILWSAYQVNIREYREQKRQTGRKKERKKSVYHLEDIRKTMTCFCIHISTFTIHCRKPRKSMKRLTSSASVVALLTKTLFFPLNFHLIKKHK